MTPFLLTFSLALLAPSGRLGDQIQQVDGLILGGRADATTALGVLDDMEKANDPRTKWFVDTRLYVLWKRALCEFKLDRQDKAQELLEKAIDAAPAGHGFLPLMHRDAGEIYLRSWKLKKAADHLQAALDQAEPPAGAKPPAIAIDPIQLLRMRLLRAECFTFLGENEEALKRISPIDARVHEELQKAGETPPAALTALAVECAIQLAELDRRSSKISQAIGRLQRCLDGLPSDKAGALAPLRFQCLILLANAYWEIARFGDAAAQLDLADQSLAEKSDVQQRDLEIARANWQVEQITSTIENKLEGPKMPAQLDGAEKVVRQALRDCQKVDAGPNSFTAAVEYELAQVQGMRGRVLDARRQRLEAQQAFDRAGGSCDEALKAATAVFPDTHDLVLQVRRFRAWVNLQRGNVDAARKEAEDALGLFIKEHKKDHVDCGLFYGLLLEIEEKAGNADKAADYADAHRGLTAKRLPYLTGLTAPVQLRFFEDYDEPALHGGLRLGVHDKALADRSAAWLINGKAKIAEVMARVYQQERGRPDAQEFQQAVQRQAYLLYGPAGAFSDALLDHLESEKRDLAEKQAGDLAAAPITDPIRLDDLRKRLGPEEIYIDVYRFRPELNAAPAYYAWVVAAEGPVHVVKLGDAEEIDRRAGALQDRLEECGDPKRTPFLKTLYKQDEIELRQKFLQPLSDLILPPLLEEGGAAAKTRWVVSPDGALWNVPWAALLLPKTHHYAVEDLTLRYVISGRDLVKTAAGDVKRGSPWIVADPDFDRQPREASRPRGAGDAFQPLKDLDAARDEGEEVADCLKPAFKGVTLLTDGDATKEAFLGLRSPAVAYLSTHSFSLPAALQQEDGPRADPLLCCGLAFAGCNFIPDVKKGGKEALPGLLTGAEVVATDLRGTDLVVLSSCQSGTGAAPYGQSPADLRHAFHLAGAGAVVSTLWSVDDKATRDLMVSFMQRYAAKPNTDKADALAEAQREMIQKLREGPDRDSHPFFWAAFTLSGY